MPPRLRLNGILNAVTRRGPFLGNSAGVIAMVYNGTNSTIGALRGKHDPTNSVVAGAISGAIFKSTRGTRPMAISAAVCASVAGGWAVSHLGTICIDQKLTCTRSHERSSSNQRPPTFKKHLFPPQTLIEQRAGQQTHLPHFSSPFDLFASRLLDSASLLTTLHTGLGPIVQYFVSTVEYMPLRRRTGG